MHFDAQFAATDTIAWLTQIFITAAGTLDPSLSLGLWYMLQQQRVHPIVLWPCGLWCTT